MANNPAPSRKTLIIAYNNSIFCPLWHTFLPRKNILFMHVINISILTFYQVIYFLIYAIYSIYFDIYEQVVLKKTILCM